MHLIYRSRIPASVRVVLGAVLGVLAVLVASVPGVAAYEPLDSLEVIQRAEREARTQPPRPTPTLSPAPPRAPPKPEPAASPDAPGYDISYPQCGGPYPEPFGFAVVGVNGGRVYGANPCLGPGEHRSQLEWAGPDAQLYANTGNPGPELSSYWPHGQTFPRECDTPSNPGADTLECAYDYGWNAAEHSYRTAVEAFVALGWAEDGATRTPTPLTWWLDVETTNSWRSDPALNVAALEGARDYLESVEVAQVGFYSTHQQWFQITGGTRAFDEHPAWHAGATRLNEARRDCADDGLTGGELVMTQYLDDGFDANHACG